MRTPFVTTSQGEGAIATTERVLGSSSAFANERGSPAPSASPSSTPSEFSFLEAFGKSSSNRHTHADFADSGTFAFAIYLNIS